MTRLSNENLHATTVARGDEGVMILGPSGSGKSDLALRLIDRGFSLVSDDRSLVRREDDRLHASAPPNIKGKMEIRGLGIVEMETIDSAPIRLAVQLGETVERYPFDVKSEMFQGVSIRSVHLDARAPSAPIIVEMALGMIAKDAR